MGFSRWLFKKKRSTEKENMTTLSDIIRGLQFCVNSSAEIMQQHYLTVADKYTDSETERLLTKRIKINDGYYMDVPLICLSDHHSLYIDEMNVKMNVNINDMALKEAEAALNGGGEDFSVARSSFSVELGSGEKDDGSNVGINIKFKSTPPPEAFARIIEKLDNMIAICEE